MAKDRDEDSPELVIALRDGTPLARIPENTRVQLQYLSTRLELNGGMPSSIAITSALPGEGVTYIAQALAAVLSQDLGRRICLIDANWSSAEPSFEVDGPGLAGVMLDTAALDDQIQATRYGNLSLIGAGELTAADRSRLSISERMAKVLVRLQGRFDHVLVDLPAVSASTSALTITSVCDAALLVTRQRATRPDQIEAAIEDLHPTRVLGIILNDYRLRMPSFLERRLLDA